ncbi:amino acid adenylation domain-containing protein [Streptomyces diastaticus]|uniref:amino acid adenylation domain-containing protein n=1 Tax=Streptomyces diastaticus TaxID=1956 RepID=UPI0033C9988A
MTRHIPAGDSLPSWEGTLGTHFVDQVGLRPHADAVIDGARRISYAELHERASAVADALAALGVRRESLVGLVYERSADAVVAMLGIVLAQAAYVPVNPGYPQRRIRQIADEAALDLVLCASGLRDRLRATLPADVRVLDLAELLRSPGPLTAGPADRPAPEAGRSPLAYVMFTSGSTGRPKGVMVEHRGVLRLVKGGDWLPLGPDTRFLHGAALEFDASTLEIWGALLNGGTLCVADRETMVVPWRLAELLRASSANTVWLTAALFHRMVEEDPGIFEPVRTLLTGGDVVSPDYSRRVLDRNPGLTLLNGYGPTENTTFTTVHAVDGPADRPVPIGQPIRGTTVLVRDEQGRPVPDGTVGELYTGGAGLARGYLGRPDLTGAHFVTVAGERYYRTGDRVRRDPDGLLHFHGRTDDQVKIAGNLVVVSEVNAALLAVPGVTDAYVRAVVRADGERRLVAYVVAPDADDAAVRTAMEAALPTYMCPDQYLRMAALPLNANGKVDRRALPPPEGAGIDRGPRERPLSPAQAALAGLWAEVLGQDADWIGAEDDFFDRGGDSLRLGQLIGRIARAFGVHLSLSQAFTARTLSAMSREVQEGGADRFRPIGDRADGPVPLHPQQRGMYALWQADPDSLAYNIPVRLGIRGPLDPDRLHEALRAVVRRHDALRMRFAANGETVLQEPVAGVEPSFVYREAATGGELDDFVRPFAADRPPHLRALLVRTGPERHDLYLDTHHAVFDGVSLRVLVGELFDLCTGGEPEPPQLRYAACAQWSHDRLATAEGAADAAYWQDALADPPVLALPTDRPRRPLRAARGAVVSRTLDASRAETLRKVATRHRTTLYSVLLAGYTATLSRLTGQDDLVLGSPLSGRVHPDLETVVGMFVSTVCLRARLRPDSTLTDLIGQLGDRGREAQEHQGQPFGVLADRLGAARVPGRNPLFDAFFALQDIPFHAFQQGGLDVSLELLNPGTTRFDLNLQAYVHPDRLVLDLEYAADLFDAPSMDYLLDQFLLALADIEADDHRPVRIRPAGTAAVPCPDFDL